MRLEKGWTSVVGHFRRCPATSRGEMIYYPPLFQIKRGSNACEVTGPSVGVSLHNPEI